MARVLLVVVVAALLLSGCSVVSAPQPGLTADERDDVHRWLLDVRWRQTGLRDELRPPDPESHVVAADQWAQALVECMNAAGFDNYSAAGGGFGATEVVQTADEMQANTVAMYLCQGGISVEEWDQSWFNPEQVDYLYDYYQQMLLPCLALHGLEVLDVPNRESFVARYGSWNPYFSLTAESESALRADQEVFTECRSMPPGMADLNIAQDYGG